ncbi:protein of unknown function [Methylacidimicrobium sp. AP8]|nr:protein of unknown function [Methylacidimicrobium sp. AP8]
MLAVCLHTAPVENLRPPRTQAHLRRLGYEICEKWSHQRARPLPVNRGPENARSFPPRRRGPR